MRHFLSFILVVFLGIVILDVISRAHAQVRCKWLAIGAEECIDLFGLKKNVKNNGCAYDVCVPNLTEPEWRRFVNNATSGTGGCVVISDCVPACTRPGPGKRWEMDDGVTGPYFGSSPCSHATVKVKICITRDMESPPPVIGYRLYLSENGGAPAVVKTWGYPAAGSSCYEKTWTKPYDLVFRAVAYNACGESCAEYHWTYQMSATCQIFNFPEGKSSGMCP